ncbi:acyltransferase domain-containing protein [Sphaerisporangium sp. TRM90804]|uniref:acyltransferase domain-containing protein n=1 Tax=Sphaerisporangium sp. TRM90804 TaxID=3031113 RepID=UPI00244CEBB5|nr:acyltransferase domain-containing protein [Sphaerisporangium sp. TRM90804]MDH2430753.1 acyltransferase domain-containing protein [Sphaerisporangium sp. TRM90804]
MTFGTGHLDTGVALEPAVLPWVLSGRSGEGLRAQASRLLARARADAGLDVAEVGRMLAAPRVAFPHRAVVLGAGPDELLAGVRAVAEGAEAANVVGGEARAVDRPVFVFPGQGTQWDGMAVELLDSAPVFAASVRECERALARYVDWSLEDVLRGVPGAPTLDRVDVVQPVLFAMMVSLARLWDSFGVRPSAVVGHSQGEVAAACAAGALSAADAARIVALRSKALGAIRGRGAMITVLAPNAQVRTLLSGWEGRLSVAAVNGPSAITVSGDADAVTEFESALREARMLRWRVPGVDFAAHSAHIEEIHGELLDLAAGITPRPADAVFYSTVVGEPIPTAELDAAYWYRNLRQTVRFDDAARALIADGHTTFIECSAQPVLTVGLQDTAEEAGATAVIMGTLRREEGGMNRFLAALAEAYVRGVAVDWKAAFATPAS